MELGHGKVAHTVQSAFVEKEKKGVATHSNQPMSIMSSCRTMIFAGAAGNRAVGLRRRRGGERRRRTMRMRRRRGGATLPNSARAPLL